MDKVINPLTGYWITKNKDTYNKLIKNGYVLIDKHLVLQYSLPVVKIVPPLPSEIIMDEIILHMMNPGHVLSTCKAFREIYHKEWFWLKHYQLYFPHNKIILSEKNYYEAYKICYNLFFLSNSTTYIDRYYGNRHMIWSGIVNNKRFIHSMTYIPNLESLEFKITHSNWQNYDIKYYYQMLPNVKSITIKYVE
jgi:hypothetical protein